MPDVFVGLGSNVEPVANLRRAVSALGRDLGPIVCSHPYRSVAVDGGGDDYLNMVVRLATDLDVDVLRTQLRAIEDAAGRDRATPDRCVLDLDLLLYGQRVAPGQRLPRPDVLSRAFVLAPLTELAPELRHPVTGEPIGEAWRRLADGRPVVRLGASEAAR